MVARKEAMDRGKRCLSRCRKDEEMELACVLGSQLRELHSENYAGVRAETVVGVMIPWVLNVDEPGVNKCGSLWEPSPFLVHRHPSQHGPFNFFPSVHGCFLFDTVPLSEPFGFGR